MGWFGSGLLALALWLLWRSHFDLGKNWSDLVVLRQGHQLVMCGIYQFVCHPMYAAFVLWGIAQPRLLHNYIAGWSHLVTFSLGYFWRVPHEEPLLVEKFGKVYQAYAHKTGRVIPRWPITGKWLAVVP
jgi:protein-S-isoprenylcysteine O-methyltransferase Ste14